MLAEQLLILKNDILAKASPGGPLEQLYADRADTSIAEWYAVEASPAFVIWKNFVTQDEIMQNGFDWVRVDNLSIGKARIWEWLFDNNRSAINPSKGNVRAGIAECWKGTAADLAVQAAVLAHCKRSASRGEQAFSTGTGSTADPAVTTLLSPITGDDVSAALNG